MVDILTSWALEDAMVDIGEVAVVTSLALYKMCILMGYGGTHDFEA